MSRPPPLNGAATRPSLSDLPPVLLVEHWIELLDVDRKTVLQQLQAGTLPGRKIGRTWKTLREEVEAYARRRGELAAEREAAEAHR